MPRYRINTIYLGDDPDGDEDPYVIVWEQANVILAELGGLDPMVGVGDNERAALTDLATKLETAARRLRTRGDAECTHARIAGFHMAPKTALISWCESCGAIKHGDDAWTLPEQR